jgi:hypothetical protein
MLAVMYARSLFCFCLLLYLKLVGFFSLGSPSRSVGTAGCKSAASIVDRVSGFLRGRRHRCPREYLRCGENNAKKSIGDVNGSVEVLHFHKRDRSLGQWR